MRRYKDSDFLKTRDFLIKIYKTEKKPVSWFIDRLNFTITVSRTFNSVSMENWAKKIGIWEDENGLILVVNSEGEN